MLTLARLEPATGVPPDARCDLAEVARDVVAQAAPAAIDRGTEIELEAAPVTVRGDAALLAILLRNLVDNAVRYSPAGSSVRVAVARDRPEGVELVVTDSGPGVPAALRGRLGDRFFREGGIDASEGSGLGLSIVKRIATLHHASVEFDDGPGGRGLCVRVRFVGEVQRGTPR
jgi:signal transduction histidine kinase